MDWHPGLTSTSPANLSTSYSDNRHKDVPAAAGGVVLASGQNDAFGQRPAMVVAGSPIHRKKKAGYLAITRPIRGIRARVTPVTIPASRSATFALTNAAVKVPGHRECRSALPRRHFAVPNIRSVTAQRNDFRIFIFSGQILKNMKQIINKTLAGISGAELSGQRGGISATPKFRSSKVQISLQIQRSVAVTTPCRGAPSGIKTSSGARSRAVILENMRVGRQDRRPFAMPTQGCLEIMAADVGMASHSLEKAVES